jgi:hypothetical protein
MLRVGLALLLLASPAAAAGRIAFPDDPCVFDVKKKYGAKGDGKADDTAAIQQALDDTTGPPAKRTGIVYLPNGTYRLTKTLVVNRGKAGSGIGPWLYGETRDGVVLKLDDDAKGVKSVLLVHPTDAGATSANFFMRNVRNLTIDAGDNPETDGIRYMATNTGVIKDVKVVAKRGNVGLNAAFIGESGPNMVQDAEIVGFDTGIKSAWMYGQTLSRITVRNCKTVGVYVVANVLAVEDLVVENTPQALFVDYPNDWTWWSGVVALVNAKFTATNSDRSAIRNRGTLFVRNATATGFPRMLTSETKAPNVEGEKIDEYLSHPATKLFADSTERSLNLPVEREPAFPYETDPAKWVCVDDHGAKAGDNRDDTAAFQKAIDAAAKEGKTTVYLRGTAGGDPNWYDLKGEVRVHGSVRHVMALGFGRVLGGKFVVTDDAAPVVKFQGIDSFGGPPAELVNRSAKNVLFAESCGVTLVGDGGGNIFATDCPARVRLEKPGQKMWARHLNPEGTTDDGLIQNKGGHLWVMGMKSEGKGRWYSTTNGGRTELFGVYAYTTEAVAEADVRPMFEVVDGSLTVAATREVCFHGQPFKVKVREKRGADEKKLQRGEGGGDLALLGAGKK